MAEPLRKITPTGDRNQVQTPRRTCKLCISAGQRHNWASAVGKIDEAHLLSANQLEELRLLTNSEMDSVAPFTGLLLGQPTLRRRIKLGAFAALDQRTALRYALPGMTEPETRDYLTTTSNWPGAPTNCSPTTPPP